MTTNALNIILVGFMGTGKTSVGQALAHRTGMEFIDMDHLIEEREGRSIPSIFAEFGEPHFRQLERDMVKELSLRHGLIVGTGGGIVINPDNIRDFEQHGLVVCLCASPEEILDRVAHDTHRPLLQDGDKMAKIKGILEKRQHLYDGVKHQVDTTGLDVDGVVDRILALYAQMQEAG